MRAMAPLSGVTSQPNLNALVEALRFTPRDTGLDAEHLRATRRLLGGRPRVLRAVRERPCWPATADVYRHEMPGGQYTNLYQQAQALGLADRWPEVCRMYAEVNQLFGDIVKVTPTSKVGRRHGPVHGRQQPDAGRRARTASASWRFPSRWSIFEGRMGQPPGGFPKKLQKRILRGRKPLDGPARRERCRRPISTPPREKLEAAARPRRRRRARSSRYLLYPQVFADFVAHQQKYSDTSVLPTPVFFYGMEPGEEISVDIEQGKTLIIKFLTVGDPHPDGSRTVFFELNGQPREVTVRRPLARSRSRAATPRPTRTTRCTSARRCRAWSSPWPCRPATTSPRGQKLLTLEAMKMETTLYAERDGRVRQVLVQPGTQVEAGDLLLVWNEKGSGVGGQKRNEPLQISATSASSAVCNSSVVPFDRLRARDVRRRG